MPSAAQDHSSLVQVSVTFDDELEDIDGAFLWEQHDQDKAYADQEGILQGESYSPLLFGMALNPLSQELNKTGYSYRMTTRHGETAKRQLIRSATLHE